MSLARGLTGPVPLAAAGMGLPARPGLYVVSCGDCVAHIGTSGRLAGRVRQLATLGTHHGCAEVLCAACCTGHPPEVRWMETASVAAALHDEALLKARLGEPPFPRPAFDGCVHGRTLLARFVTVAGAESWAAGFAEALFARGGGLRLLFAAQHWHRLARVWREVGIPPGPAAVLAAKVEGLAGPPVLTGVEGTSGQDGEPRTQPVPDPERDGPPGSAQ